MDAAKRCRRRGIESRPMRLKTILAAPFNAVMYIALAVVLAAAWLALLIEGKK